MCFMIIDTCEIIMNNHTCEIIMNNHTCEIIMNNHTCEIIDFISGGNIKLNTLFYIINHVIIWHRLLPVTSRAVIGCWRARILRNDAGIMKIVNALWTTTQNPKKILYIKTKQNTVMSDEEHSDNEFYNPEMQETAERNGGILTKLKQAEILVWKVSPGCTDFRKK